MPPAGLVDDAPVGIRLLRRAVEVLQTSGAQVEHALALVDLGAELRRAGTALTREPQRDGLARARRCGALALARLGHDELEASGVHQRKTLVSGVDALTPSERRAAQMPANGTRNRDFAQNLFVTVKDGGRGTSRRRT